MGWERDWPYLDTSSGRVSVGMKVKHRPRGEVGTIKRIIEYAPGKFEIHCNEFIEHKGARLRIAGLLDEFQALP